MHEAPHPLTAAVLHRAGGAERGDAPSENERIKAMLKHFGLRTSLIRLKVIDALLHATRDRQPIGMRGVHARLQGQDIPLSFLSVREVLKRLAQEGLVSQASDKTYHLEPQALAWLAQD